MITSAQNKRVARGVRLKKRALRERDRRFLVEGVQGVTEALSAGAAVEEIFAAPEGDRLDQVRFLAEKAAVPVRTVSPDVMARLTSTVTPQGVVAVTGFVDVPLEEIPSGEEARCVPVLVEVRDPGNAGTILRSADAAAAGGVVFTSSSVDVYNPKTVRATAGSLFHVPVVRERTAGEVVEDLRGRGYAVWAADARGERSMYEADLYGPTAILFGNEAHGLPAQARALADDSIRIPIEGRAESLNLAAAATLLLFESARRRTGDPLGHIVTGAAHDIRSPLTAIKAFSGTLLSKWEKLTEEQRVMMVRGIPPDIARMELIVAQLVDAARMASGRLALALEPTDLLASASQIRGEVNGWGSMEVEVSGDAVTANVDPARLRTILLVLVEAAHWWGDDGPIQVRVAAGPEPAVTVSRGRGPDQEAMELLLEPRAPGTGGGSKVGLFVARGLIEAHGGRLEVRGGDQLAFKASFPAFA